MNTQRSQPTPIKVTRWIRSRVREGARRIVLQQRLYEESHYVCAWIVRPTSDSARLAEEILAKMHSRAFRRGEPSALFGLFTYRRDSLHPDERMLVAIRGMQGSTP